MIGRDILAAEADTPRAAFGVRPSRDERQRDELFPDFGSPLFGLELLALLLLLLVEPDGWLVGAVSTPLRLRGGPS